MTKSYALLAQRRFFPYFCTQFFGAFNDNFLKNAIVILIAFQSATVFGMPASQMVVLAGGIFILPFFLFSATAGQLADKFEKTKIIRWIKGAEIIFMFLAAIGFYFHQFEFLLIVLFLMGMHSAFFGPIKYSILPQLLQSEPELVTGNALIEGSTFLAILLGTITGGLLVEFHPLAASLGLIFISILGFISCLFIPSAPAASPDLKISINPLIPTVKILRLAWANRMVAVSIFGISWFWLFGAAMLSLFPAYCKDILHEGPKTVTWFLAVFSVGIAIGSMLCSRLSKEKLELGLMPLGALGIILFTFDLSQTTEHLGMRIYFDLLMISISSGLFIVPLYTLMQERSAPATRSQTIAANNIFNAFFMVGASLGLLVLMKVGVMIPQIFSILAGANLVVFIVLMMAEPLFFSRFLKWIDPRKP
jgi:MFS family permease